MKKVIAMFGISGVGKSWIGQRLAQRLDLAHAQASVLLKRAKEEAAGLKVSSEDLRTGPVLDNQALLVSAFQRFAAAEVRDVLFDGHTVIDAGASLIEIPFDVIAALSPSLMMFVWDEPEVIFDRRVADTTRQRPERTVEELRDHQARAEQLAKEYAARLGVSFCRLPSGDLEGAVRVARPVLSRA